jgi:RimJ/RimL family protein N-acetyltransferase
MRSFSLPGELSAEASNRIWIRTATAWDVESLGEHFRTLSHPSRYNRFMGAVSNFSKIAFDCLVQGREADRFTLVAELREGARESIVGEVSYAFDNEAKCGEFAISVADRWQNQGLGSALLCAAQSRAVSLGHFELYGESLKSNDQMKALARKAGFEFSRALDWRAVRFDKSLPGRLSASPVGSGLPHQVASSESTVSLFTP